MKTNREQIEKIVEHAGKRKINLPADLLLSIAKSDAQELVDTLEKVPEFWEADKITGIISPAHLPLYTKTTSGIVPPPKEDGLVLMSDGWHFPPVVTNITSVTGGTRGGGGGGGVTDHALLTNLAYATSGHTGFQPTLAFPLVPNLGGTGVANLAASTLTLGAATTITGGGIIGLGGFTGTVSITGTFAMGAGTLTAVTVNDVTVAAHTHAITGFQPTMTFPLAANLGGTGVANLVASTLTLGAATSITGGGTIGLGGFTLTVPATGTAALLATQNVFTVQQMIDGTSDQIQLRVQANATQTTNLQTWENSSGTVKAGISGIGHAGFGVAPTSDTICYAVEAVTQTSAGGYFGLRGQLALQPAAASAVSATATQGIVITNTAYNFTGTLLGVEGRITNGSTEVLTLAYGIKSTYVRTSTGTATTLGGLYITGYGLGGIATSYGIRIDDVIGTTIGYAIRTNAGNIVFNEGGDSLTDFRVESDSYDALFVDASNESIVIMSNTAGKVGFYGHAAAVQPSVYTPSNVVADRSYDANSTTLDEIADVLGTLIADLQSVGLVG